MDEEPVSLAMEVLDYSDFFSTKHQLIFKAYQKLADTQNHIDIMTVAETLRKDGNLEKAGGEPYLMEIMAEVVSWAHVQSHCQIVKDKSLRRKIIRGCSEILNNCQKDEGETVDILDAAESTIYKIGDTQSKQGILPIKDILEETFELIDKYSQGEIKGVTTGFSDLDAMTGGFQSSDLIILAARPSMGKTAFALSVASNAAVRAGKSVAVFSLEMGKEQLVQRILCHEAEINLQLLRTGKLAKRDYPKLTEAGGKLFDSNIFIDDTANQTAMQIRAKCRRQAQSPEGLDLVFIDYLQLMSGGGREENRQQEISQISRALKGLAKELNIPVIALSQLNRAVESRGDARPMLSDLRESGAIEQDADIVMFIFREEVYKKDDPALQGKAELIIAKQRNGPIGKVDMTFIKDFAAFKNYCARPTEGDTF